MNVAAHATRFRDHGHVVSRAYYAMLHVFRRVSSGTGKFLQDWKYPNQASRDGQRHPCGKCHQVLADILHIFSPSLCSFLCYVFIFSPRCGSRVEVEDLIWGADKVTTILSNASSDRVHVRTLIGIA